MTKGDCELDAERLVIWVSSFLRHSLFALRHFSTMHSASASRIVDFCSAIFFPIKTSLVLSVSKGSNSQRPAMKLKSCAPSPKRTKPFDRSMLAGRPSAKRSKQAREKVLSEVNVNDSNSS